jgi:hypothetical protein
LAEKSTETGTTRRKIARDTSSLQATANRSEEERNSSFGKFTFVNLSRQKVVMHRLEAQYDEIMKVMRNYEGGPMV